MLATESFLLGATRCVGFKLAMFLAVCRMESLVFLGFSKARVIAAEQHSEPDYPIYAITLAVI